jgi:hypothetical protein
MKFSSKSIFLTFCLVIFNCSAKCNLPTVDGSALSSTANIKGLIVNIDGQVISIHDEITKKNMSVILPTKLTVYTAFGGDGDQRQLVKGQYVSVWFKNCKRGPHGTPTAAYFQIYSFDPKDRP